MSTKNKYTVSWSETLYYCVEVEADNIDDAEELAHGKVYDDEDKVVAYDCDMSDCVILPVLYTQTQEVKYVR